MSKKLSPRVAQSMYLKLLPMQMFAVGVLNINGILNSLLIGNMMGTECLAVFGFMVPINCIHNMLGGGIATGSQILCGRYIGCGDRKKIGDTYAAVSVICIVMGALLTAVYLLFPVQIASLLGASGAALDYTSDYLRGFGWSIIFMMFSSSMIPFLQLSNASRVMYTSIGVMTGASVVLDILSISVFSLGMYGVGLASAASYLLGDLVILLYYLSEKCPIRWSLKDFRRSCVKEIFRLGLPNITRPFCLAIRNLIFNNVAVRIGGTLAVTAVAIVGSMGAIADAINGGIDGSTNMIASIFYGERDKESLREVTPIALKTGGLMQAGLYALIFFTAKPFAMLFGAEGDCVPFTVNALRIVMMYLLINIYMDVSYNIYKGIGRTGLVNIINVVNFLVIPISTCLTLPKVMGVNGVWVSYLFPEAICYIGLAFYAAYKRKQFPRKFADVTYIPEGFGIESSDRCDVNVKTLADVPAVSQKAIEFCRAKGLDSKKSFFCGLCIEELAAAILEHGAEQREKHPGKNEIDLRMIYENDGISILLRDNYPPFDPLEWARIHEPEDPMRYIGVRTVTRLAQELNYSVAINLNVLSIRI